MRSISHILLATALACVFSATASAASTVGEEVYSAPKVEELKASVDAWLLKRDLLASPVRDGVAPLWNFQDSPGPNQLFDALMRTYYFADDDVRSLVDTCMTQPTSGELLDLTPIMNHSDEPLFTNNVQYFYARHLAVLNLYEEALLTFDGVEPHALVDPAGYFFYRAVCEHHLLLKEDGLATISKLLNDTEQIPLRYQKVGELLQNDLENLEEKSIGEVARQMRDVERRLELGRAGQRVQRVEERIIATLDEIIEKMEQQQSGGGGGGGGQMQTPPSGNPSDESYVGGVKGPGETDRKDVGHKDDWGDLPPKAQTAAKNLLERQFPAHYRQAVEEYLKKIAERPAAP
ncbi:MAG: hypothetical protein KDA88_00715 [Planctomycetaceae bacterium]|nr:hypothetical protein [Planctomycetaceae bacterium]MCB9953711.1 hypothetical protein [Planctomycetaceae bacterium]